MPQIDETKLNEYADLVFDRCNYFNDYVLETIGRRIKATGQLSAYDQQALKNVADISGDMKAITKKLAEITEMNVRDIQKIYKSTMTDGVDSYKPLYDFRNTAFVPFEENEFAQNLVRHWATETANEMVNLSRTKALCFDKYNAKGEVIGSTPLEGAFQKAIDDAVIAVSSGTTDFNSAMRETIMNLGGSGVKVTYGSGVNRSLSGMVRQNLLYGAKQAAQSYDKYIGEQLGCDGFEVDYHSHPRPWHEEIGGGLFALGNKDITINGITYKSENKPLSHGLSVRELLRQYGCLHFEFYIIPGVSEPRYDEKWLAEQKERDKELIEFNGTKKTKYEWQKAQRRLERAAKEQNDIGNMAKASGDNILAKQCRDKVSAYKDKYDELCDTVGLEKRHNRMAAYNRKALTSVGDGGIIGERKKKETVSIVRNQSNISTNDKKVKTPKSQTFDNGSKSWSDDKKINLHQHEQILNGNRFETAVIYNSDGDIVFKKKGTSDTVNFTKKEIQQMRGCVVTHNHPNNSCFSVDDINMLRVSKASEMRASTRFGTYVINPSNMWDDRISTYDRINIEYNKCLDEAILKAKDQAAREGKHVLTYLQEAEFEGTKKFCDKFGLKFRMEAYKNGK